jgi:hypothetical protein
LLAGAVTGSLFKIRTLLILLGFVCAESILLVFVQGSIAGLETIANLIALQIGYFTGVYTRSVLEHAGYSFPSVRTRRIP